VSVDGVFVFLLKQSSVTSLFFPTLSILMHINVLLSHKFCQAQPLNDANGDLKTVGCQFTVFLSKSFASTSVAGNEYRLPNCLHNVTFLSDTDGRITQLLFRFLK
jgi:hypothetical protein